MQPCGAGSGSGVCWGGQCQLMQSRPSSMVIDIRMSLVPFRQVSERLCRDLFARDAVEAAVF